MAESDLPLTPNDLTPEWLNRALAEVTRGARIVGFEKKSIGVGAGFMGQLARLTLEYAERNESAPTNIIAKFASASSRLAVLSFTRPRAMVRTVDSS